MTDSVVVAVRMTLVVRGAVLYELQGAYMTFRANGVNAARCTLAVGRNEEGRTVNLDIEQGDQADIYINGTFGEEIVNGGDFPPYGTTNPNTNFGALITDLKPRRIFSGIVDDWGPTTISNGQFAVEVRCFGRLAYLSSGTLQTSNIISKSYADLNVNYAWGQAEDDQELLKPSEALGSTGFWAALREAMIRVATTGPTIASAEASSITKEIYETFGTSINESAAAILADLRGRLAWRDGVSTFVPAIAILLNDQMRMNWMGGSFFEMLVQIGEQLMFSVLEYGRPSSQRPGYALVPYHPFWQRAETNEIILGPETWNSFQWELSEYQNYAGAVLTQGTGQEFTNQGTGEDLIVGLGQVPDFKYGRVHVAPAPAVLSAATTTIVDGGTLESRGTGYATEVRDVIGDYYARIKALELNYAGRRCRVSSPCIRTDIGPLTAVRIDFPNVPEIIGGTAAYSIYGSVQGVTLAIDAAKGYANTSFEVGYVRSHSQQQSIDRMSLVHPFFAANFTGQRLDGDPYDGDFDG